MSDNNGGFIIPKEYKRLYKKALKDDAINWKMTFLGRYFYMDKEWFKKNLYLIGT